MHFPNIGAFPLISTVLRVCTLAPNLIFSQSGVPMVDSAPMAREQLKTTKIHHPSTLELRGLELVSVS